MHFSFVFFSAIVISEYFYIFNRCTAIDVLVFQSLDNSVPVGTLFQVKSIKDIEKVPYFICISSALFKNYVFIASKINLKPMVILA